MNIKNLTKEHRYEFVCVVLALLLLLALWPALRFGSDAKAKAAEARKLLNRITKLRDHEPEYVPNKAWVDYRELLAIQTEIDADDVAELLIQQNQRPFLMPGVFPQGKILFGFRESYEKAVKTLYQKTLRASWPTDDPNNPPPEKAPTDIAIYVEKPENLGIPEWVYKSDYSPTVEDCWFAQLALWIQQDVAQVINDLNIASAEKPSVANAPVKRIISIKIDPAYYPAEIKSTAKPTKSPWGNDRMPGAIPPGFFRDGAMIPGIWSPSMDPRELDKPTSTSPKGKAVFTERLSNDQADVVRLSFSVIVDSRSIDKLLAALNRKNLYTIVNVSLSRQDVEIDPTKFREFRRRFDHFNPRQDAEKGLIYGTDPVVKLDVEAEILFLRKIYEKSMPKQVKKTRDLEIVKAQNKITNRNAPTRNSSGKN